MLFVHLSESGRSDSKFVYNTIYNNVYCHYLSVSDKIIFYNYLSYINYYR